LERLVFGRFLTPEARKTFFESYKEIEALLEILSPDPALRDHIATYKQLSQLYAAVRNAYAEKVGFVADLAYKTRRLIEESAEQQGLGRLTKTVTFDVATLKSLRGEGGSDEGKVFNLVRGLQHEIDEDPAAAPVLQLCGLRRDVHRRGACLAALRGWCGSDPLGCRRRQHRVDRHGRHCAAA
jgi:type I restriction enzyme, R subunit